jgi:phosphoribosylformimino-5-aminoimidazole carboxamide ribotide isomerase
MQVIPAIDIKDGAVVRLYKGDFAQQTVFSDDPVKTARGWEEQGAPLLHVVDLDGTEKGSSTNWLVVAAVADALTIPVQMGGGLRDLAAIEQAVAAGVTRVVLGTVALEQPELVAEACARYPGRVVVALDARNGKVMTHGWQQDSGVDMLELAQQMVACGVSRFLYTDVERDGTLSQPNFEATGALAQAVSVPVIASGGVATLAHLTRLTTLGVEGSIVGSALYRGAFTLPEALATIENHGR